MSTPAIELATESDVRAILALANASAETAAANFATEPETLEDWTASYRATSAKHPWLVARRAGEVIAFAKASPHRARGAYRWTAEVSVYVEPTAHASGVGTALYRQLVPTLRAQGYMTLLAGIASPNPPSERLHARFGFERCGTYHRAGYKLGAWHDVGYWEVHLQPKELAPEPIDDVRAVWSAVASLVAGHAPRLRRESLASDEARALIAKLDAELSATYPEPGATHFRLDAGEVAEGQGAFFLASVGAGAPIGCGAIRRLDDATAELKRMYVAPRWRGLGLSKAILDALEAEASRVGVRRVRLETGSRQTAAVQLYERAGYRPVAPWGEYVGSPLSVCLEKEL